MGTLAGETFPPGTCLLSSVAATAGHGVRIAYSYLQVGLAGQEGGRQQLPCRGEARTPGSGQASASWRLRPTRPWSQPAATSCCLPAAPPLILTALACRWAWSGILGRRRAMQPTSRRRLVARRVRRALCSRGGGCAGYGAWRRALRLPAGSGHDHRRGLPVHQCFVLSATSAAAGLPSPLQKTGKS